MLSPGTDGLGVPLRARARTMCAAAVIVAIGVSACGSSKSKDIDVGHVEHAIAASVKTQRRVTASVFCPTPVARKQGERFTCVAQVGSQITPFLVTESYSSGAVSYKGVAASAVAELDTSALETAIAHSITTQRHLKATVRCPATMPREKDLDFVCTATTAHGTVTNVDVTQTDGSGNVTYKVR